jgi:hypothetical protein
MQSDASLRAVSAAARRTRACGRHQSALAIEQDEVAVGQHQGSDAAAELALQVVHVAQACAIVLARVHERGLSHSGKLFLPVLNQRRNFAIKLPGRAAAAAWSRRRWLGLLEQGTQPRILDAPGVALGKNDEIAHR